MKKIMNVARIAGLGLTAMLVLSACVHVEPGPGHWVPGHYDRMGYWVPGHNSAAPGPRGMGWAAGHYNRAGNWVPGHWR